MFLTYIIHLERHCNPYEIVSALRSFRGITDAFAIEAARARAARIEPHLIACGHHTGVLGGSGADRERWSWRDCD